MTAGNVNTLDMGMGNAVTFSLLTSSAMFPKKDDREQGLSAQLDAPGSRHSEMKTSKRM